MNTDDYTYSITITGSLAHARLLIALEERIALCRTERDLSVKVGSTKGTAEWEERIDGLLEIHRSVENAESAWHAAAS